MARILVVDDEKVMVKGIRFNLENEGYTVDVGYNGRQAVELARANEYDLIILDLMMPELDGLQACMEIRAFSTVPIIMLTARGEDTDKLLGFEYGADDYITKPFNILEVKARVKALLRRYCVYQGKDQVHHKPHNTTLELHGVRLALDCNRVWVDEREVDLTETEYRILRLLMQNPQRIFSIQVIYETVWNEPYYYVSNGTVMVHIRNLRMKVEDDPQKPTRICTVWGKGYRFVSGEEGGL